MIPHLHDPCIYCGTPHDEVEAGDCPDPNNPWRMNSVEIAMKHQLRALPTTREVTTSGGYGTFIPRAK